MDQALRMVAAVAAIAIGGNGILLINDPEFSGRVMDLPLVAEFGLTSLGFFLFIGAALAICGAWTRSPVMFYCAGALIGAVIGFRICSSVTYNAPLSVGFVLVELIMLALWIGIGIYLQRLGGFILPTPDPKQV
ncbi:MAG: hypothetical protein FJ194_16560 [Gammaproteobacteria bacterium]|nr:hypothetical protein [Gammaproteobacteria bacterium]